MEINFQKKLSFFIALALNLSACSTPPKLNNVPNNSIERNINSQETIKSLMNKK